ncbi:MAG TPA: 3-methyl-2-oxobutanoate hydroxymethyltransferase [Gammaproteobacteria bacterium]|nr:3-methyl-2-oxobutanoate hydroxymethyltransferase [Gammaproteobacteria bacterium]
MAAEARKAVTTASLRRMKAAGERIAVLTAYDASFTQRLEEAGVEVILVGDSLGMVIQGRESTLGVHMEDMIYHAACVARAGRHALRVVDMPFMSYASTAQGLANAARLMAEGGAHMVKLEGGEVVLDTVAALAARGIPVCAHLGLTPQSVNQLGGYRVQGREAADAERLQADALALQEAGASMLVLECVPAALAGAVSRSLEIPVIGIGAGPECDGQVLVLYDMLGITPGRRPGFSHDFLQEAGDIPGALKAYVEAVKSGAFPGPEHSFS